MSGGGRCAPGQIAAWNECSVVWSVNSVRTCWKEDEADIFVSGVLVRAVGGKVGWRERGEKRCCGGRRIGKEETCALDSRFSGH